MSVSEAMDRGYAMMFTRDGVKLYQNNNVQVRGAAVLEGKRDVVNNLFYIELPDASCIPQKPVGRDCV